MPRVERRRPSRSIAVDDDRRRRCAGAHRQRSPRGRPKTTSEGVRRASSTSSATATTSRSGSSTTSSCSAPRGAFEAAVDASGGESLADERCVHVSDRRPARASASRASTWTSEACDRGGERRPTRATEPGLRLAASDGPALDATAIAVAVRRRRRSSVDFALDAGAEGVEGADRIACSSELPGRLVRRLRDPGLRRQIEQRIEQIDEPGSRARHAGQLQRCCERAGRRPRRRRRRGSATPASSSRAPSMRHVGASRGRSSATTRAAARSVARGTRRQDADKSGALGPQRSAAAGLLGRRPTSATTPVVVGRGRPDRDRATATAPRRRPLERAEALGDTERFQATDRRARRATRDWRASPTSGRSSKLAEHRAALRSATTRWPSRISEQLRLPRAAARARRPTS